MSKVALVFVVLCLALTSAFGVCQQFELTCDDLTAAYCGTCYGAIGIIAWSEYGVWNQLWYMEDYSVCDETPYLDCRVYEVFVGYYKCYGDGYNMYYGDGYNMYYGWWCCNTSWDCSHG